MNDGICQGCIRLEAKIELLYKLIMNLEAKLRKQV